MSPPSVHAAGPGVSPEGKLRFVAVGSGTVALPKMLRLEGPDNDAQAMAKVLETTGSGVSLVGPRASRAAVWDALAQAVQDARPGDTILFYFSGYSSADYPGSSGHLGLFLSDARTGGDALMFSQVASLLTSKEGVRAIVILDSSASGLALRTDEAFSKAITIMGGTTIEHAFEPRNGFDVAHGLFTSALLTGCGGAADADKDGRVALREAFVHVVGLSRVTATLAQTPFLFGPDVGSTLCVVPPVGGRN